MTTPTRSQRSNTRRIRAALALLTLSAVLVGCPKKAGTADSGTGGDASSDPCRDEFVAGQPTTSTSTELLCHDEYISVYDPARKVPLVVAEKLQPGEFDGSVRREGNQFRPDPGASQSATMNDYTRSGYARGHMAPAGDFSGTEAAMNQSFYFSNVVPQNSAMNSGLWSRLERATRDCAKQLGTLYVLTGPVFEGDTTTVGSGDVAVPSAIYKIMVSGGRSRAFVVPNQEASKRRLPQNRRTIRSNETSVDEVQRLTGLSFFPAGGVSTGDTDEFCNNVFASK
ncbi:DNA/RNA non-specific endonuclease [Deinococcus sp.]|uniref:DNA/RNA non-specific endonuclease n=1 Tax=Deinococcus sp. TaxID=47478 RepID=UPI0025CCF89D|nr:DNA/RNA non-specific endonuclease [Deinococcus sp.]